MVSRSRGSRMLGSLRSVFKSELAGSFQILFQGRWASAAMELTHSPCLTTRHANRDALGAARGIATGPIWPLYIEALRLRRVQNGVFAVNLQYWHFTGTLMNNPGNALFTNAFVVSLIRPDIAAQLTSWRVAMNTGKWDFSDRRTSDPRISAGYSQARHPVRPISNSSPARMRLPRAVRARRHPSLFRDHG